MNLTSLLHKPAGVEIWTLILNLRKGSMRQFVQMLSNRGSSERRKKAGRIIMHFLLAQTAFKSTLANNLTQ